VSVPVLSVKRTSTHPSSSGIDEFRVMVSKISLSLSIEYEYQIFAKSRFTLKEIGMMEHSKSTNQKNINPQFPWNPFKTTIVPAKKSIKTNRIFDKKLISSSIRPILDQGPLEFYSAHVSQPV
jgi:hypothetical protein